MNPQYLVTAIDVGAVFVQEYDHIVEALGRSVVHG